MDSPTVGPRGSDAVEWPAADLESVAACPLCGSKRLSPLYSGLTDRGCGQAGGTWDLVSCAECGGVCLAARPTPAAVGRAYAGCPPSAGDVPDPFRLEGVTGVRRIKRALECGYVSSRYGYALPGGMPLGRLALGLLPTRRTWADGQVRCLALPRPGARLLDVGCGSGEFLVFMRSMGWDVHGIDLQAARVEVARQRGIEAVVGTIETTDLADGAFDAVSLNHVIEHLHAPVAALRACHRLLKPGGCLTVTTPNLGSIVHRQYRRDWVQLDSPRHLVLCDLKALVRACETAGFRVVRRVGFADARYSVAGSEALRHSGSGESFEERAARRAAFIRAANALGATVPALADEVTVVARRA